jgi:hypothetical protein
MRAAIPIFMHANLNLRAKQDESHPLHLAYLAARAELQAALIEQWAAYARGGLSAFRSAHEAATRVAAAAHEAEQACYDAGIAFAPYWHVTPAQMRSYARNIVPATP